MKNNNQKKDLKTNVDESPAKPMESLVRATEIKFIDIASVVYNPRNANIHTKKQIDELARLIGYQGFRNPVVISNRSGFLLAGHGRIEAIKQLGWTKVPAIFQDFDNEAQEYSYLVSDNEIARWAMLDYDSIHTILQELPEVDTSYLGIENFKLDLMQDEDTDKSGSSGNRKTLVEKFLIPPFSVFDTRQGYWQRRVKHWIGMGINDDNEGRKDELTFRGGDDFMGKLNEKKGTTSVFDPALAEILYSWFSPKSGFVLDPFAGGAVRGVVASNLERQYIGIDLRAEQVESNRKIATQVCDGIAPVWTIGDSKNIHEICKDVKADFVFSCPPYADLEQYSDNPADLSNMKYQDFKEAYFDIINKTCSLLNNDSFAVFVVGEVRDTKGGGYYNFVSDTISAFQEAGLKYYNEIILVNQSGTGALRCERQMKASRKIVKTHQNVLVFVKGDAKKATLKCGDIEIKSIKDSENSDHEEP